MIRSPVACRALCVLIPLARRVDAIFLNIDMHLVHPCSLHHSFTGALQVHLNRFDLFHAHLFLASSDDSLGILFHAKEFPAHSAAFPYYLGYCQDGSDLKYTPARMAWRNFLWYQVRSCSCCSRCLTISHRTSRKSPTSICCANVHRLVANSPSLDPRADDACFGRQGVAAR